MFRTLFRLTVLVLFVAACVPVAGGPDATAKNARILVMGDSMMSWNGIGKHSVADSLARNLGQPVENRAIAGAQMVYHLPLTGSMGMKIANQYRPHNWDWIVVNGGGNDLVFNCGCSSCSRRLNMLASPDGTSGEIPLLLKQLRATGARVVYVGYLRSPGVDSNIENCKDEGDELDRRVAAAAARDPGIFAVSLDGLVPDGDTSYHARDIIHPSAKGSAAIGDRVAQVIINAGPSR